MASLNDYCKHMKMIFGFLSKIPISLTQMCLDQRVLMWFKCLKVQIHSIWIESSVRATETKKGLHANKMLPKNSSAA